MIDRLKKTDVFNERFNSSMVEVNPECVNPEFNDGVTAHDYIEFSVKNYGPIRVANTILIEENSRLEQKIRDIEKLLIDASIQGDSSKQVALSFMRVTRDMVTMLNMAGTEKEKDSINPFSHWLWLADELLETYKFIGTGGDPI